MEPEHNCKLVLLDGWSKSTLEELVAVMPTGTATRRRATDEATNRCLKLEIRARAPASSFFFSCWPLDALKRLSAKLCAAFPDRCGTPWSPQLRPLLTRAAFMDMFCDLQTALWQGCLLHLPISVFELFSEGNKVDALQLFTALVILSDHATPQDKLQLLFSTFAAPARKTADGTSTELRMSTWQFVECLSVIFRAARALGLVRTTKSLPKLSFLRVSGALPLQGTRAANLLHMCKSPVKHRAPVSTSVAPSSSDPAQHGSQKLASTGHSTAPKPLQGAAQHTDRQKNPTATASMSGVKPNSSIGHGSTISHMLNSSFGSTAASSIASATALELLCDAFIVRKRGAISPIGTSNTTAGFRHGVVSLQPYGAGGQGKQAVGQAHRPGSDADLSSSDSESSVHEVEEGARNSGGENTVDDEHVSDGHSDDGHSDSDTNLDNSADGTTAVGQGKDGSRYAASHTNGSHLSSKPAAQAPRSSNADLSSVASPQPVGYHTTDGTLLIALILAHRLVSKHGVKDGPRHAAALKDMPEPIKSDRTTQVSTSTKRKGSVMVAGTGVGHAKARRSRSIDTPPPCSRGGSRGVDKSTSALARAQKRVRGAAKALVAARTTVELGQRVRAVYEKCLAVYVLCMMKGAAVQGLVKRHVPILTDHRLIAL